ncbi:MAG: hypothetical protein HYW71_03195, partial [Candidatus Niyogibacteria bacterium]|nr:hypothetical protein [Candidatus Niyogibacteria bacterium]
SRNPLTSGYYESGSTFDLCLKSPVPRDTYLVQIKGSSSSLGDRYANVNVNVMNTDPTWKEI